MLMLNIRSEHDAFKLFNKDENNHNGDDTLHLTASALDLILSIAWKLRPMINDAWLKKTKSRIPKIEIETKELR